MQKKKINVRLSKFVVPIKYEIKLHPDLENFTFGGTEVITVNLLKDTKEITLNSKEIDIETVRLDKDFSQKITYNQKAETATFVFDKKISKGKHTLTITFQGILNDKMRGFYRSSYVYEGKVHNIATTQFEATDARRAFPCFDEPAQKAVFNVSLVIPKGKTAISNTLPISKIEHEAGFEVIKFAPTPKMSTYLLAFIVGDFEYLEKKSKGGVLVRVYTAKGKKNQAKFSLDVTAKVLDFYEEYFDIKYPLNTLDMIAVPDFSSLAMENWGAITFREIGLLVDENNTSIGSKESIVEVIAHELAHQWFGNLVTMEWWTHLWLNEGFASYVPYIVVDKLFPEWNIWERFSTQTSGIALKLDSLLNTHPIEVEVHHPDEIGEIFDEVSYSKGASVIRMLADYLGEEDFRLGLSHYLKKHSYKNTETIHLWEAFEKISKKPVAKMMQNWTGRGGYPVINASLEKDNLILKQNRFFLSPISKKKANDKTLWQVPVSIKTEDKINQIFLNSKNIKLGRPMSQWMKLNAGEAGFYRTAYSKELLASLHSPVLNKVLPPIDRLGIVRDLFTLAEAGIIPTTDALEFLSAYKNEDNYTVWTEIASGLSRIEQTFGKTSAKSNLDKLTIKTFTPVFQKLGWEKKSSDSHTDAFLRSLAIARLGRAGDKKIIAEAKKKFASNKSIHPDIRSAVYTIVATHGGIKEYNILIKMYKAETLHEEKNRIGSVLGDFDDDKILCLTSEFALSKDVRIQDTIRIISSIAMNSNGRMIWLKCIKYNWDTFLSRYGDGGHTLGRLIKAISATPEKKHLEYFKAFVKSHKAPGAERSIEQVLERLENNALWLARDSKQVIKFLKNI